MVPMISTLCSFIIIKIKTRYSRVPSEARKRRRPPLAILHTSVLVNLKEMFTVKKNYCTQNQYFFLPNIEFMSLKSVGLLTYSGAYTVVNTEKRKGVYTVIIFGHNNALSFSYTYIFKGSVSKDEYSFELLNS
jgi:hypothetical protein